MISFDLADGHFTFRVAGVACGNGKVLLQNAGDPHAWFLPGGRVEIHETAEQALRREMQEELHVTPMIGGLLWVAENFFARGERRYHEVGLYFAMQLPDACPSEGEFPAHDDFVDLWMRWTPLDELDTLVPAFLRQALLDPPLTTRHVVHQDAAGSSTG